MNYINDLKVDVTKMPLASDWNRNRIKPVLENIDFK